MDSDRYRDREGAGTLMATGAEQNEAGGNGDISTEP